MIDFAFTAEQEEFRQELRRFACAELAPRYRERAAQSEFCWAAHRQLAGLGVLGLGLPEKFGGAGEPDPITLGLATEALAYGDVNVGGSPVPCTTLISAVPRSACCAWARRRPALAGLIARCSHNRGEQRPPGDDDALWDSALAALGA